MPGPTPADIAAELQRNVAALQQVLAKNHGVLRGTFEAVLAEAQGAQMWQAREAGRVVTHLHSFEQTAAALIKPESRITELLLRMRSTNPQAARQMSRALEPLLSLARDRIRLMEQTRNIAVELRALHPQRFANMLFQTGPRTVQQLISSQLPRFGMRSLLPGGISNASWVAETMRRIRQLPVSPAQAATQVATATAAAQAFLRTFAAQGARSFLAQFFGGALRIISAIGTRLISVPLFIIVDENGNPIGMPGRSDPGQAI